MSEYHRRRLLTAAGAGLTALLAGCQGGGDSIDDRAPTETASPSPTETTTDPSAGPAALKERARAFVGLLAEGSYEAAHERFNQTAGDQIPPERLRRVWTGLEERIGDFVSLSRLDAGTRGRYDVVTGIANFERGRREVVLAFGSEGIAGFRIRRPADNWSPPDYADESAFTEREISLRATDECVLGGTLTVPDGVERAPGVVIVHGQGPQDRDGTVGPNKPYKDLAWGLASRGVAVLRYEKRTAACDPNSAEITIDEAVTEDALAAVDALRETDVVADGDVVVAGHSIGATLAPRIATRDGNLAGVAMLAPLARPAGEAILDQNRYLANRDGTVTDAEREQLGRVRRIVERIRSLDVPDDETIFIGGDEYWRTLREYDRFETARAVAAPRLLLFGERDYQVTVEDDLPLWREALGEEDGVTFRRYSRLNHLFMPGSGKPGRAEYFRRDHVAERVVADIAAFAADVTGVRAGTARTATATTEG